MSLEVVMVLLMVVKVEVGSFFVLTLLCLLLTLPTHP